MHQLYAKNRERSAFIETTDFMSVVLQFQPNLRRFNFIETTDFMSVVLQFQPNLRRFNFIETTDFMSVVLQFQPNLRPVPPNRETRLQVGGVSIQPRKPTCDDLPARRLKLKYQRPEVGSLSMYFRFRQNRRAHHADESPV